MKRLKILVLVIVSLMATSVQAFEYKTSFFSFYASIDYDEVTLDWMQGYAVLTEDSLSYLDAVAMCLGCQSAPEGVVITDELGVTDIEERFQYVYLMQRLPYTYGKYMEFELKLYQTEAKLQYQLEIISQIESKIANR